MMLKKILQQISLSSGILVDNTELEDKMDEFVYRYQVFAHQVGTFKEVRKELLEFQLTMTELTKELLKRNDLLPQGSKRCFGQVEDHSEVAIDSSKPITKKLKFAKLTPRTDLAPAFSCKLCGKKYGWLKSLARHVRENHEGEDAPADQPEVKDLISCRICKTRQRRANITRHLYERHNIKKKGASSVFRGFITFDEIVWQPLFLEKGEEDPPAESSVMVPVNDGKVTLYGVEFEIDDSSMGEKDDHDGLAGLSSDPTNLKRNVNTIEVTQQRGSGKGVPKEKGFENDKGVSSIGDNDDHDVLAVPVNDGKVSLFGVDFEIDEADSSMGEKDDHDVLAVLSSAHTNGKKKVNSVPKEKDQVANDLVDEDLNLEVLEPFGTPVLSEEVADRSFDEVDKPAVSRRLDFEQLTDEFFNDEINSSASLAHGEKPGVVATVSKHHEMPKIKVQVFSVDVQDGDLWSAITDDWIVDSDFEEGDTKEEADFRREMKHIRLL